MGKRSAFIRNPRDYYRTADPKAVNALRHHLAPGTRFIEPCAGNGILIGQLSALGHKCLDAWDIEPQCAWIGRRDASEYMPSQQGVTFVSNPPWRRPILHKIIRHLSDIGPTWLLIDASWIHTGQCRPMLRRMRKIVSIGRMRWMDGTTMSGKDDSIWVLFDKPDPYARPVFFGPVK